MLAINIIMNLAKIMLIFNGLNVSLNNVDATISPSSLAVSSSSTTKDHKEKIMVEEQPKKVGQSLAVDVIDVLNIRHERSKQRRHSSLNEKEQQLHLPQPKQQLHLTRTLHENNPGNKELQLQHKVYEQKAVAVTNIDDKIDGGDDDNEQQQIPLMTEPELNEFSQKFHSSISSDENENSKKLVADGLVDVNDNDVVNNVTEHLNNVNDVIVAKDSSSSSKSSSGTSNIKSLFEATAATHHLTPSAPFPTTTLKTVTHKIRKLHKKKIVESLRQLNIDKFHTNGGHLTKNHHRSLLEAEQLQQQAQWQDTNKISHKTDENQQQQEQQKQTTTVANSRHQVAKEEEGEEYNDEADMITNDIDTNESVNDSDLPDIMDKDDAGDGDDNDDDDKEDDNDNDDNLSDVFYQNDENVSNVNDDEDDDDVDELYVTTHPTLLDDKFDKQFKNFSSEFIKDIDNNVDLDDNETENENSLTSWHEIKYLKFKPLNLSGSSLNNPGNNSTEDAFNTTFTTEFPYDFPFFSEDHSLEPLLSASTSQGGIHFEHQQSQQQFYEKEEINFNDSFDLTQDDSSASKDLIMDEAVMEDGDADSGHANGFPLSSLDESDSETDTETEGISDVAAEDETNHFLEGVVDAANSEEIYDWDEISRSNRRDLMHGRDVVTKFLQIVETQHSLGSNCEAGTSLNLGEGVVDRYAQDRFRIEAEVAVNRANMLTRIFKMTLASVQADVNLLHASVLSMVEFDDDIFAAGHCFDWNEHPAQPGLFCPFAYRLPPPNLGAILAKDLAMEYHYLGNTSEWFFQARKNAEKVIARNEQYLKAFHLYSNKTDERIEDDTLAVKYEDGRWSKPYYDCGGGNIWMLTYTVPFFGYENSTYHFKGTSGIDIDLRRVDIDQCPQRNIPGSTKPLNIFAGTDKCKQRTTMCEAIQGLGFRRGSYKCVCRKGYYFPDTTSQHKYFNGSLLEEEYEKLMLGKNSTYNIVNEYECLPCAEGCDYCEDSSPCIAALNWPMRTSILALACVVIGLLPPAAWFTFRYQQVKVVRAASPALLRVIALGAFFIYCTNIVMYPNPNLYTCTARIWLREIGFSLTYGALMLKTWRISVIFRVRSAKAVKITDAALLKRLGCICGAIGTCLLVRTLVSPPDVVVGRTADDLKAFLCKTDWWDYTFTSMEVVFLAWGVRLCIMVRKAPSEFNESRFISMAIYNEFLLTCFLNVSMLFLQSPANPDLLYIIFFCHTQLTITLLLALIFGSKVYIVLRSGKSHQENIGMGAKSSGAKFNFRPQVRTFANPSSVTTSTVPVAATTSAENKLSDQEALEEVRQLSMQLQRIQEMAPPKGVAVMTISSLLDGLKTPSSMVMVAAAASQGAGRNQLTVRPQKTEALPLLSLNTEMQKYQQLQVPQKTMTTTNNNVAAVKTTPAITLPSTQVTVTTSTPTKAITEKGRWEEKAVNTEIIGNCIAEEELKNRQQQQEHIICRSCYEKCKDQLHHTDTSAKLNKCQILGSPQQEGSISFKNIKLDCMCSQSDDLDQLTEPEQQTIRRITKRTAATNTPPSTTRKRAVQTTAQHTKDAKAISSVSLPNDESHSRATNQTISYVSQQQKQQQQICDNCKNKFKRKESFGKATLAAAVTDKKQKSQQQLQQQHRKLSRLSSKCNKLIADIENSKGTAGTKSMLTNKTATGATKATTTYKTSTKLQPHDCDEETQYSTDDIIFYTTTDTSDSEDDEDDDDEDVDDEDDNETEDDENANAIRDDDLSSSLSHSKSESRVTTTAPSASSTSSTQQQQTITQSQQPPPPPPTNGSNGGSSNGKAKRPDKLVLNLNDRSKFTKEVSV
ncbi:hypothetical protein FF38_02105 [Lucilia cuprina]|uniref:G-protein coupled receptors family 3 profile domain-containing protein n=1 Tax=Lucilia cuprina TaxID=7375 RepID=A0A0L0CUA3_LUCCU|nr:hypothetical protein FF38_02105 [Lucilia cuprina]